MTKPRVAPYMRSNEVCRLFGLAPTKIGRRSLRKLVKAKVKRAAGKLDDYDPYTWCASGRPARFTMVGLRRMFPERFEPRDELAEELREKFVAIQAQLEELAQRLTHQCRACRERDDAIVKTMQKIARSSAA